ncbi:UNVERIFIED_CONTAM: hypothetical protein FKN15_021748 [Acipenser sinensis]
MYFQNHTEPTRVLRITQKPDVLKDPGGVPESKPYRASQRAAEHHTELHSTASIHIPSEPDRELLNTTLNCTARLQFIYRASQRAAEHHTELHSTASIHIPSEPESC